MYIIWLWNVISGLERAQVEDILKAWVSGGRWNVTGQRLADQAKIISLNGLFSELEEIERRVLKVDIETKDKDIDEEKCDKVKQNVDQQFDEPRVNWAKHDDHNVELTPEQETLFENIKHTYNQILIEGKCALNNMKYIPTEMIKENADKINKIINIIPTKTLRNEYFKTCWC